MEQRPYHILAGSILLALLLWFMVKLGETYSSRISVPLTLTALGSDLALESPLPETIDVTVEGPGWQLLYLSIADQMMLDVPASAVRGDRIVLGSRLLGSALKLPQGVVAVQAYPETLVVRTERAFEKKVPLRFNTSLLTFREGFGLTGALTLEPDSVVLTGSERFVQGITSWPVEERAFEQLTAPVMETLAIVDSLPGVVRRNVDRVRLFVPVEQLADVRFHDVPVTVEDVPLGREVLLAHSRVDVIVRGGISRLAQYASKDFQAIIDYPALMADTTGTIVPRILMPESFKLLQLDPPAIGYTIRK